MRSVGSATSAARAAVRITIRTPVSWLGGDVSGFPCLSVIVSPCGAEPLMKRNSSWTSSSTFRSQTRHWNPSRARTFRRVFSLVLSLTESQQAIAAVTSSSGRGPSAVETEVPQQLGQCERTSVVRGWPESSAAVRPSAMSTRRWRRSPSVWTPSDSLSPLQPGVHHGVDAGRQGELHLGEPELVPPREVPFREPRDRVLELLAREPRGLRDPLRLGLGRRDPREE